MTSILNVLLADNASSSIPPGSYVYLVGASHGSGDSNGVSTVGTPIDTTGADLLVLATTTYIGGSANAISDVKGNTWHALTAVTDSVDHVQIYWSRPTSVGAGHSFDNSTTGAYPSIAVLAFSGSNASPFDVETNGSGTSSTASAGSGITPTQNNELIVAAVGFDANAASSINASFIISADAPVIAQLPSFHQGVAIAYKIQTAAAAVDPDWALSGSANWVAAIASFKGV